MSLVNLHAIILDVVQVADAAMTSFQVLDGRDYSVDLEDDVVLIGYTGSPGEPVVSVARSVDEGSPVDTQFDVTIRGSIASRNGDEEFTAKRAVVWAGLEQLNAALESDLRLGGSVLEVWLMVEELFQIADTEGNSVEADFTITVRVFA
jgi:hypothetical protein